VKRCAEGLQAALRVEEVAGAAPRGGSQGYPAGSGLPGAGAVSSGDCGSCAHPHRLRGGAEMSSAKQIEANRRNAQKSKGPRTAAGKARASRNSRKHALSTIRHNNPLFAQRIEAIAREICPETTNSGLWQQALIVGECTTILICVQATRIALIEQSLGSTSAHMTDADAAGRAELGASQCKPAPLRDELEAMGLAARDLNRLDAMNAGRYHAASEPSRLSWRSPTCRNPGGLRLCELPSAAVTPGIDKE